MGALHISVLRCVTRDGALRDLTFLEKDRFCNNLKKMSFGPVLLSILVFRPANPKVGQFFLLLFPF